MQLTDYSAVAIGWDVRGWQGSEQAVAIVAWHEPSRQIHWFGVSPLFRLSSRTPPDLEALIKAVLRQEALAKAIADFPRLTLGIDAPLAFSRAFKQLLQGQGIHMAVPKQEIENPYAYRDCERWLYRQYGKKPLSASFDRLGNNATLVLSMMPHLNGLSWVPGQVRQSERAVIEVYPALAKTAGRASVAMPAVAANLPADVTLGCDRYDAAICALIALQYAGQGKISALPPLVMPEPDFPCDEGWIYHFSKTTKKPA